MDGVILIADTDRNTLSTLKNQLASLNLEILTALTNEECMTATIGKNIKLALISLDFPGMADGSLSNLLHITSGAELPIIGLVDPDHADYASDLDTLLIKPVDGAELKKTVESLLDPANPRPDAGSPPVNLSILREASCDEHDVAVDLIHLFFETTDESSAKLEKAITDHNAEEISAAAHKCCGAAASCGLIELERRMRVIEAMGKENRLENVRSACDEMQAELENCRRFLEKEFKITIK